jgi:hypothetical protein
MDFNRIDKDLKKSIDSFPFSLEINQAEFLNNPEIIQKEKKYGQRIILLRGLIKLM